MFKFWNCNGQNFFLKRLLQQFCNIYMCLRDGDTYINAVYQVGWLRNFPSNLVLDRKLGFWQLNSSCEVSGFRGKFWLVCWKTEDLKPPIWKQLWCLLLPTSSMGQTPSQTMAAHQILRYVCISMEEECNYSHWDRFQPMLCPLLYGSSSVSSGNSRLQNSSLGSLKKLLFSQTSPKTLL